MDSYGASRNKKIQSDDKFLRGPRKEKVCYLRIRKLNVLTIEDYDNGYRLSKSQNYFKSHVDTWSNANSSDGESWDRKNCKYEQNDNYIAFLDDIKYDDNSKCEFDSLEDGPVWGEFEN